MGKVIRLTETKLKNIIAGIVKEQSTKNNLIGKRKKLIKESINIDIEKLISIAERMGTIIGRNESGGKWEDYVKSFTDVFKDIELSDEQSDAVFGWFQSNFPKAPNHRLSKYLPSLTYQASEYDAEGGFANERGWDDSDDVDNSDSWSDWLVGGEEDD
jgi:hypothetical protein